jgi:hypothetical protein
VLDLLVERSQDASDPSLLVDRRKEEPELADMLFEYDRERRSGRDTNDVIPKGL